jgi:dTDP-4-dehydrorhamnose 3,5-epimerase
MSFKNVKVINLKKIENTKGAIIKILNKKDKNFKKFGEIYFSEIKKNEIKGWNLHKKFFCHITICYGDLIVKLKNQKSETKKIQLSILKPRLLIIPPGVWFSLTSKKKNSMIINILSGIHDPKETLKQEII